MKKSRHPDQRREEKRREAHMTAKKDQAIRRSATHTTIEQGN